MDTRPVVNLYPLSNYNVVDEYFKVDKYSSLAHRHHHMKLKYSEVGMKRSVEGILLVQEHNHPYVLILGRGKYRTLPGGRLRPGEDEIEGLKRKLSSKLAADGTGTQPEWQIGELVAVWWRPNFDTYVYPYRPPHITKPKECKKVFIVQLPEKQCFAVASNWKLVAVSLFDLYDNMAKYGYILASIPEHLSRFHLKVASPSDTAQITDATAL